jgi:hypothetical protein
MKTKLLMTLSALVLGILGVAATFLPQEILAYGEMKAGTLGILLVQMLGAAYLGFAMLNWMNRENLMGGIYNRPAALGNFFHFTVVALALLKDVLGGRNEPGLMAGAVLFSIFAVWFGKALFGNPLPAREGE